MVLKRLLPSLFIPALLALAAGAGLAASASLVDDRPAPNEVILPLSDYLALVERGDTLARQLCPVTDVLESHVIEDCGHIIPLDRPDALVPLLRSGR